MVRFEEWNSQQQVALEDIMIITVAPKHIVFRASPACRCEHGIRGEHGLYGKEISSFLGAEQSRAFRHVAFL